MKNMIGEVIKLNNVELLVLDEINGNPFVLAYNLGEDKDLPFSTSAESTNNYAKSNLRNQMEKWFKNSGFKAASMRNLDLTTMDGYNYGDILITVAPLTFDEFRKYASIIQPKVTHDFWLATGWGHDGWAANSACNVFSDGKLNANRYSNSYGFAPAFILDKAELSKKTLSDFSVDELLTELAKRIQ